ncbi:hypothetical protein WA026_021882 [Henosepilachna vigintioctopunctata]|uniref:Uncharacterized protein n=1 Tax=Henosepilachna vigintioctopunctata TaxID=420089 RepID=A0AAW1UJ49_9CUCU
MFRWDTSAANNIGKLKFIKIINTAPELASGTALFLSENVDHQVQLWLGKHCNPEDWCWEKHRNIWIPIHAPAPPSKFFSFYITNYI